MSRTFNDLIQLTIKELAQVPGTGTQLYAEDAVAAKLQTTFNMVLDELWWPPYMEWFQRTLDGTLGVVTAAITGVTRYEDIRAVFRANSDRPLAALPRDVNPYLIAGTSPRFIEALFEATPAKLLQFYPKTATGTVYVHARKKPDPFVSDDVVYIDEDLLKFGAAWQYLEDDGTTPASASKAQGLFEARLKQLKKLYGNKPIVLDPRIGDIPVEWWARN